MAHIVTANIPYVRISCYKNMLSQFKIELLWYTVLNYQVTE